MYTQPLSLCHIYTRTHYTHYIGAYNLCVLVINSFFFFYSLYRLVKTHARTRSLSLAHTHTDWRAEKMYTYSNTRLACPRPVYVKSLEQRH